MNTPISANTIKRVIAVLNSLGLLETRADYIQQFTDGRTGSTKEMYEHEADAMIAALNGQPAKAYKQTRPVANDDKANNQRRRIIAMAHELGWTYSVGGQAKADMKRIDDWCVKFSYLKKPMNEYTLTELPKLVSQFQLMSKDQRHRHA